MAGTIIADKIQTENSFLTLNVGQTLVATINSSGILNSSGGTMVGANGSVSNTAITGVITASQLATSLNLTTPIISGNLNLDSTGTTGLNTATANTVRVHTNGVERMRIDSNGNVGIGTNSPENKLYVRVDHSNSTTTDMSSNSTMVLNNSGTGERVFNSIKFAANQQDMFISAVNSNAQNTRRIGFFLGSVGGSATSDERLSIFGSGAVRVACANTLATPSSTNQGVEINNTNSGSRFFGGGSGTETHMEFGNTNGTRGSIQTNSTNTVYNTTSDYRLKKDVVPMTGALAKVAQLKPSTYKWRVDNSNGQGFIAHELQSVVPECVTGEKDAVDADGNPKYQMVDTSFLVATLTAAIQELKAIVDAQAVEIAALKAK